MRKSKMTPEQVGVVIALRFLKTVALTGILAIASANANVWTIAEGAPSLF